jgi:hypothetical protein
MEQEQRVVDVKKEARIVFRSDISDVLLEIVDDCGRVHIPLMRANIKLDNVEGTVAGKKVSHFHPLVFVIESKSKFIVNRALVCCLCACVF